MKEIAKRYLRVSEEEELEVFAVGRCYRLLTKFRRPIVTKVDWGVLGMNEGSGEVLDSPERGEAHQDDRYGPGALFLNTPHFDGGVTLSLGSGKVMSELLFGPRPG